MRRAAAAAVLAALSMLGAGAPAEAAATTEVVQGEVLRLVSVADWEAASSLLPGKPVQWDIAVSADAPDPGTVRIGISASGGAPLVVDAALCMAAWQGDACPDGETVLRTGWDVPRDGAEVPLAEIADTEVAHLRLSVALGGAGEGSGTEVRVHASGAGESAIVGPGGGLATTGMPSPAAPWILGGAAVLAGILLLLGRRRSEDRR